MTKVDVDSESKIKIYITLFVNPEAVIKDLSSKLQKDVKDAIKKSLDLEVTEVNIRIKNITVKKEPTIKEQRIEVNMNGFKEFIIKYRGAILGGLIANFIASDEANST